MKRLLLILSIAAGLTITGCGSDDSGHSHGEDGIILMKLLFNNRLQMTVMLSVLEGRTMTQIMIPLIPMMTKAITLTEKRRIIPMARIPIRTEMGNTVFNSYPSNKLIMNKL